MIKTLHLSPYEPLLRSFTCNQDHKLPHALYVETYPPAAPSTLSTSSSLSTSLALPALPAFLIKYKLLSSDYLNNISSHSILSFPGGLEDEIRKYIDYKNRESTFLISRLDNDIKHLEKRIELAKQEIEAKPENSFLESYISDLKMELVQYKQEQNKVKADIADSSIDPATLSFIRKELKDFVAGIWTNSCDVQHAILEKYVVSIAKELSSDSYKMFFQLKIPDSSSENLSQIVLEEQLYFTLD